MIDPVYKVVLEGGQWVVKSTGSGLIQFRSLKRANCTDWLKNNSPKEPDNATQFLIHQDDKAPAPASKAAGLKRRKKSEG